MSRWEIAERQIVAAGVREQQAGRRRTLRFPDLAWAGEIRAEPPRITTIAREFLHGPIWPNW